MTRKATGPAYDFRPMSTDHLAMVNAWLDTPEVARWWIEADGLGLSNVLDFTEGTCLTHGNNGRSVWKHTGTLEMVDEKN